MDLSAAPFVTCLMPTANRRRYVPHAIDCFLRQDYPDRELLVVDDGSDQVRDLLPDDARVRYVHLERRLPIGTKRNAACEMARGDVIVHWDDDDWSASWRVACQVSALETTGADVCGLDCVLFYEPARDRAWEYRYPPEGRPWIHGATLCYRKGFWRGNPFPGIRVGEDTRFVWSDRARRLARLDDRRFYVGTIHASNTSPKQTFDVRWRPRPLAELQAIAGDDWPAYRSMAGGSR